MTDYAIFFTETLTSSMIFLKKLSVDLTNINILNEFPEYDMQNFEVRSLLLGSDESQVQFSFNQHQQITSHPQSFSISTVVLKQFNEQQNLSVCGFVIIPKQFSQQYQYLENMKIPLNQPCTRSQNTSKEVVIQQIQKLIDNPEMNPVYQIFQQQQPQLLQKRYNPIQAQNFVKAFTAFNNVVQKCNEQDQKKLMANSSSIFLHITNLYDPIVRAVSKKIPNEDLNYLFFDVQLLAHCWVMTKVSPRIIPLDLKGESVVKNIFETFYAGNQNINTPLQSPQILPLVRIIQAVQQTQAKTMQRLRFAQKKFCGQSEINLLPLDNQKVYMFLVRDAYAGYCVMLGIDDADAEKEEYIEELQQVPISYPAEIVGEKIFESGQKIALKNTQQFKIIDVIDFEFCQQLLIQNSFDGEGLTFFRNALNWAMSTQQQNYFGEQLRCQNYNATMKTKLCRVLQTISKEDFGVLDLVSAQLMQRSIIYDMSSYDVFMAAISMIALDLSTLIETFSKQAALNSHHFYQQVSEIYQLCIKEILTQFGKQQIFKVQQEFEMFKQQIYNLINELVKCTNPIYISEQVIQQLILSLIISSKNKNIFKDYNINLSDTDKYISFLMPFSKQILKSHVKNDAGENNQLLSLTISNLIDYLQLRKSILQEQSAQQNYKAQLQNLKQPFPTSYFGIADSNFLQHIDVFKKSDANFMQFYNQFKKSGIIPQYLDSDIDVNQIFTNTSLIVFDCKTEQIESQLLQQQKSVINDQYFGCAVQFDNDTSKYDIFKRINKYGMIDILNQQKLEYIIKTIDNNDYAASVKQKLQPFVQQDIIIYPKPFHIFINLVVGGSVKLLWNSIIVVAIKNQDSQCHQSALTQFDQMFLYCFQAGLQQLYGKNIPILSLASTINVQYISDLKDNIQLNEINDVSRLHMIQTALQFASNNITQAQKIMIVQENELQHLVKGTKTVPTCQLFSNIEQKIEKFGSVSYKQTIPISMQPSNIKEIVQSRSFGQLKYQISQLLNGKSIGYQIIYQDKKGKLSNSEADASQCYVAFYQETHSHYLQSVQEVFQSFENSIERTLDFSQFHQLGILRTAKKVNEEIVKNSNIKKEVPVLKYGYADPIQTQIYCVVTDSIEYSIIQFIYKKLFDNNTVVKQTDNSQTAKVYFKIEQNQQSSSHSKSEVSGQKKIRKQVWNERFMLENYFNATKTQSEALRLFLSQCQYTQLLDTISGVVNYSQTQADDIALWISHQLGWKLMSEQEEEILKKEAEKREIIESLLNEIVTKIERQQDEKQKISLALKSEEPTEMTEATEPYASADKQDFDQEAPLPEVKVQVIAKKDVPQNSVLAKINQIKQKLEEQNKNQQKVSESAKLEKPKAPPKPAKPMFMDEDKKLSDVQSGYTLKDQFQQNLQQFQQRALNQLKRQAPAKPQRPSSLKSVELVLEQKQQEEVKVFTCPEMEEVDSETRQHQTNVEQSPPKPVLTNVKQPEEKPKIDSVQQRVNDILKRTKTAQQQQIQQQQTQQEQLQPKPLDPVQARIQELLARQKGQSQSQQLTPQPQQSDVQNTQSQNTFSQVCASPTIVSPEKPKKPTKPSSLAHKENIEQQVVQVQIPKPEVKNEPTIQPEIVKPEKPIRPERPQRPEKPQKPTKVEPIEKQE